MFYFAFLFCTFPFFYTSQTGLVYKINGKKIENRNTDVKRFLNITEFMTNASRKSYICTCTCFECCSRAIGVYKPQRQTVFSDNNLVFDSEETISYECNDQEGNYIFMNNQWQWTSSKSESNIFYIESYSTNSDDFRDNFSSKSTSSYNIPTDNEQFIEYDSILSQNESIDRFKHDQFINKEKNDQQETMTMPKNSDPVFQHGKQEGAAPSNSFCQINENEISNFEGVKSGNNNTIFSEDLQIDFNRSSKQNFQQENVYEHSKTNLNVISEHHKHDENLNPILISNKRKLEEPEHKQNARKILKAFLEKSKIDKINLTKKVNISLKNCIEGYKLTGVKELYGDILDNIEILYNSDLRNVVNPCDEFYFERRSLLGSYKELSDAIINIAKKYIPKVKDEGDFNYLRVENIFRIEYYDHSRLVNGLSLIYKFIEESVKEKSFEVFKIFKNLKDLFNGIFMKNFNQSFLQESSADIYGEIFKIFIDISQDPIFSVVLHEFSTFNVENNINYFKKVDEIDILNIIKFKIIIRSYKYLFFKIRDNLSAKDIIDFVFNSRYYLRRYLLCCFSSIWEPNFLKLYMRITCYNINKKSVENMENMISKDIRKIRILSDIKYFPEYYSMDLKENFIKSFFQIDFDKFIFSLTKYIRICEKKGIVVFKKKIDCIFAYLVLTKAKNMRTKDIFFYEQRKKNFMDCYLKTLNIYIQNKSKIIYKVLTKNYSENYPENYPENNEFVYDEKKYEVFDFFEKSKIREKCIQNLMVKLHSPEVREIYRFWVYFDDESIRDLIFNNKPISFF